MVLPNNFQDPPYEMTINLSVLNHLGIGLYSNVPAVLSEIVANAWDADAENVYIDIDTTNGIVTIYDDGHGMTQEDINKKYLTVGYRKREQIDGGITPRFNREPMGRKGIGKLSVFSIAEIVEIYSIKNNEQNAFRMDSKEIQQKIKATSSETYKPTPLYLDEWDFNVGTKIVLKNLTKNMTTTATYLRRRIARRFSVIGTRNNFAVHIDDAEITPRDRDYYKYIEFVWYIGADSKHHADKCINAKRVNQFASELKDKDGQIIKDINGNPYKISGWIGTVDEQRHIDEESNTIVIFAHGKLVHENLLKDLKEGGIFSKYIIGEIDANFLDDDPNNDIVTSARQSLKEDDPLVEFLRSYVRQLIKSIGSKWTPWRKEEGAEKAINERPNIRQWYETLQGDRQVEAKKLLGKLESLEYDDDETKKTIYKNSLIGFHQLSLKDKLSLLDSIETEKDFELFSQIFGDIIDLERVHYYDIANARLEVIKKFREIIDEDKKERVIQEHLFDALWLLDPSWDRAATNSRMEERITTEFKKVADKLTDEELKGRLDIRYQLITGKHVIVELKKYSANVNFNDLFGQIRKYRSGLRKALEKHFPNYHKDIPIEVIAITGTRPRSTDDAESDNRLLNEINARLMTYDELIDNALNSYKDYLKAEERISQLVSILNDIDEDFEND